MSNLKLYCVTNKNLDFLEKLPINLVGVGQDHFPNKYIKCDSADNIYFKEKYYSELTFHYWYWKNLLNSETKEWVGFCQKRRFWMKNEIDQRIINETQLRDFMLTEIDSAYQKRESFICQPISVSTPKKIKIIKRGWRNLIRDPMILFSKKKQNILLHFDMHHGYRNLERAITYLDKNDRDHFLKYVKEKNSFNPNIMCISRPEILDKWFSCVFNWLERCENEFGFDQLKGYDTLRLYAYLAERFMSYWFKRYTNFYEQPWAVIDI